MDMYQKRKMRQEKNMKKNEGQDVDNKTNITGIQAIWLRLENKLCKT